MKKAKIVLSSIAILGITGTIFAFKAGHFGAPPVFVTTQANAIANLTFTRAATISAAAAAPYYFYTAVKGTAAPLYSKLGKQA